ncbi:hypothetical protein [Chelativorans sp. Marseille-P2723]|uniref:hypothetical protein n=1 Tax=Chelativorans sp. Marseille-P2723 TaxID=2709133 RepID=UPI00156D9284|nr:hypothetical protein [Chelativorans sp. Marseille-P2723]
MHAIKRAITSALAKGDTADRAFREKVYRQALAALDRSLNARPDLLPEQAQQKREELKAAIIEVEKGFLDAPGVWSPEEPEPRPDPRVAAQPAVQHPGQAPQDAKEPAEFSRGPEIDLPIGEIRTPLAAAERERSPFKLLFVIAALIALAGIGGWWLLQSGMLQSADERGASVTGLQHGVDDEEPGPDAELRPATAATEDDWIFIFSPDDPTTVSTPSGAMAEAASEDNESFLKVSTPSATAAVSFDVGQGTLEDLAGRRAIFSLTARAQEGEETQISVSCDFGDLGSCGRTRYIVGEHPSEYLLEVELPDVRPSSGGTISIVPDVEGRGRALDIFSLRATTGA